MRNLILVLLAFFFCCLALNAQVDLTKINDEKTYLFITHDGAEIIGKLISFDEKEVNIESLKAGELTIPTYQLKEVREVDQTEIASDGSYVSENIFATRYFITTNGLPIRKNESYVLLNWYGPDVQYGISDQLSIGLMTSWIGAPVVGSLKFSKQIDDNKSFAIGALVGTLGWAGWEYGGALPFAAFTSGNRVNNFTISAGYGAIWFEDFDGRRNTNGDALFSLAGMRRINNTISLAFDSFILAGIGEDTPFTAILIPGFRFQRKEGFAFQLGLSGVYTKVDDNYQFLNVPLPMVQLFFKF